MSADLIAEFRAWVISELPKRRLAWLKESNRIKCEIFVANGFKPNRGEFVRQAIANRVYKEYTKCLRYLGMFPQ